MKDVAEIITQGCCINIHVDDLTAMRDGHLSLTIDTSGGLIELTMDQVMEAIASCTG